MRSRHTDVIEVTRCTITIVTEEGAARAPWAEIVAHTQLLSWLDIDTKCRNKIAAALSPSSPGNYFQLDIQNHDWQRQKTRTKEN